MEVQSKLVLVCIGDKDQPYWSISKTVIYNCADSWEAIRIKQNPVIWWRLVWFPMEIPKQVFILWLAARDGLSTGERLLRWGFDGAIMCVFCRGRIEGISHLFFDCNFCRRVWKGNMGKFLMDNPPYEWDAIVELGVRKWTGKDLKAVLCKLVPSATVYNIWRERNNIKHGTQLMTKEKIIMKIS